MPHDTSAGTPAPAHNLLLQLTSDQPAKAEITPLDYDAARVRGNKILSRHRAHQTFKQLRGAAATLLFAMADFFGVVREHCAGLIVDVEPTELAASIGVEWRTLYRPLRALESVGAIRRINRGGPYRDAFELVMPPEPDQELLNALASDKASRVSYASDSVSGVCSGDLARATREASRLRDAGDPNNETLARATSDASLTEESQARATSYAADQNARATSEASRVARAFFEPARATSYASSRDAGPDPQLQLRNAEARATSYASSGPSSSLSSSAEEEERKRAAVAAELAVCRLPAATVDQILSMPSLDLRVVIAARLDCQANQRRHRGPFPIGLFTTCLKDPSRIAEKFFDEADRLLNPSTPAASPTTTSLEAQAAREIERRVDEFITSRTREQLDDLRRQAIELAVTASGKEAVMKTDPIKHHVVRMLVRTMLGGGGQQS